MESEDTRKWARFYGPRLAKADTLAQHIHPRTLPPIVCSATASPLPHCAISVETSRCVV